MKKENKVYNYLTVLILLVAFIFMCRYASKQSFWGDELDFTIRHLNASNLIEMFKELLNKGFNLPLSYVILYPVYKIAPYGELWLLLPCIVACIIGMYFMKKIGDKIGGNKFGIICLLCAATSYIIIYQGAYELRPYAFFFCFSALALYRYLYLLEDRNKKNIILYTISLILLVYTHWFGSLIAVFYFCVELYLWIRKKIKISFILPYVILGIIFLPWLILMMKMCTTNVTEYWGGIPTIKSVVRTITYHLLSDNLLCKILFVSSLCLFIVYIALKKYDKIKILVFCILNIIFVITPVFIYSKYINPNGSLFVPRYFFCLLPPLFLILAFPLKELLEIKFNKHLYAKIIIVIILLIFSIIGYKNYRRVMWNSAIIREPYREISKILEQKDIYSDDSVVITSMSRAFLTYYFEKRIGKLPANVICSIPPAQFVKNGIRIDDIEVSGEDLLQYNKIYIIAKQEHIASTFFDFLKKDYKLTEEYSNYNLYIYEKNINN